MRIEFFFKGQSQKSNLPVVRALVSEGVNLIPRVELLLVSKKKDLDAADYLGQKASLEVHFKTPAGIEVLVAVWQGVVFEFGRAAADWAQGGLFAYRAVIRSSLWKLGFNHRSRAFNNLTRPKTLAKALKDAGIKGFKVDDAVHLKGAHPKLEQIVQYDETDLDFVLRLMRMEGMNFFFLPVGVSYTFSSLDEPSDYFRVTDGQPALKEQKNPLTLKFQPRTGMVTSSLHVDSVAWRGRAVPKESPVRAYFVSSSYQAYTPVGGKPKVKGGVVGRVSFVEGSTARQNQNSGWTPQDYADSITKARAEEFTGWHSMGAGSANDINIRPCVRVKFNPDPFSGGNDQVYKIIEVKHRWDLPPGSQGDAVYRNDFGMIKDGDPLRPPFLTPWSPRKD